MPQKYKYFNRDISWLAFNKRVLEEAGVNDIPLSERLRFLAIYSSNLDEFYGVRVAEYRNTSVLHDDQAELTNASATLLKINKIVSVQINEFFEICRTQLCPALLRENVKLYFNDLPSSDIHHAFMHEYFMREIIPYLQPVLLTRGTRVFLRDNRPYFAIKMYAKKPHRASTMANRRPTFALVKLPVNDLPRFVELPKIDELHRIMFLDDIIRYDMHELFPGYDIDGMWSIKITRDADIGLGDETDGDIVEKIKQNLTLRKTGIPASLYYDKSIARDLLRCLKGTFDFKEAEMVASGRYFNLHHFLQFPTKLLPSGQWTPPTPIRPRAMQQSNSLLGLIRKSDQILHYPYQSFDYVIKLLYEAAIDPMVEEIKITLYRVATNSAVVNSLISAAQNNKRVTVFVELKARFDEENNLEMSERMKDAGIKIIYSIPRLKVHAKMCLIIRREGEIRRRGYAYLSTGNFNEKTARQYTDHGLFTCDETITDDLIKVFEFLEDRSKVPDLQKLLVTQVNLLDRVVELIERETAKAKRGEDAYILLKMNGLQNHELIDKLYEASLAGVHIDLIIRGICCLVPDRPFSKNICVRRIVDMFLEHGRVWIFGKTNPDMYLTSSDWLNRNIHRRIEVAFPIENQEIKQEIMDIMSLQLADSVKAQIIDHELEGHAPEHKTETESIRAQAAIYDMLLRKENTLR